MRKIVAASHTTFDGVMSGPQGDEDNMVSWAISGLIDEYRIMLHPVILGSGKRLFDNIDARSDLRLESAKPYPNGAILLRYARASQ